ncbi:DNA polymerase III subunit delta [Alphaproteobacteria bacterium]|nr:DNA polymerase III subunit delta [Alphaproteobacteria bacterium]
MKKLSGSRIEAFIKAPDPACRAVLIYGPDAGLVFERLTRLTGSVVPDLDDPFRISEFNAAMLKSDPARLADEVFSISMTGGRRVVRIRQASDSLTKIMQDVLGASAGDTLILVEGGDLGPRSSLRKLFETADGVVALPCYADDGAGLARIIQSQLKDHGLTPDRDALDFLTENLGADRGVTRSEMEKLALYMGAPGVLRLEDAQAVIDDGSALSLDDFIMATAEGNHADAQKMLGRLCREGANFVQILRALSRHFQRLHLVAGKISQGSSADSALSGLKPPLYFRVKDRFRAQLDYWTLDRLGKALILIVAAEDDCKKTGAPVFELCSRLTMQLAAAARR